MKTQKNLKSLIEEGSALLQEAYRVLNAYKMDKELNRNRFFSSQQGKSVRLGNMNNYDTNETKIVSLFVNYNTWVKNTVEFIENKLKDKIEVLFFKESSNIPENPFRVDTNQRQELVVTIIDDIKNKNEHLRELYRRNETIKENETTLEIDESGPTIYRKDNHKFKLPFRKKSGTNKRFKYLIKIINDGRVSGEALMKHTDISSMQTLSKEIKKINEACNKNLGIVGELIINENNSGYEINSKYAFEFIK